MAHLGNINYVEYLDLETYSLKQPFSCITSLLREKKYCKTAFFYGCSLFRKLSL